MNFFLFLLFTFSLALSSKAQPFLHTRGKQIVTADGKPFVIKGTNLGNWLVPEGYMFKFNDASSPRLINQTFSELIGPAATKSFWKKLAIVPLKYTHQANPSDIYLSLSLPPLNFLGPGRSATIELPLRRSVQGSVRFSSISVAVYPERSEGSHSSTFGISARQIRNLKSKI